MVVDCAHCQKTGTCRNGQDGTSCAVCIKKAELASMSSALGLPCGICGGYGQKGFWIVWMPQMVVPVLALIIVGFVVVEIWEIARLDQAGPHQSQILTMWGVLGGSVTGYYFGGRASDKR